jgi:phosphoglucomutase
MNKTEVQSVLQRLNNLNKTSGASEGEELHVSPMFLDYANDYIKQLAELLDIDLEG